MISMPLRMSNVMKRKLKKWVNRTHNGNPSWSVSSITRKRQRVILFKLNAPVVIYRWWMVFVKGAYPPKIFCWADVALETIQVFCARTQSERGTAAQPVKLMRRNKAPHL